MSEKERFVVSTNEIGEIIVTDVETGKVYDNIYQFFGLIRLLNEQQAIIDEQKIAIDEMITNYKNLEKENEQLRQKIKHCVYVDVDNENGCMNCNHNVGSICSILDCGTHDYLEGVSECGLKYWECKYE